MRVLVPASLPPGALGELPGDVELVQEGDARMAILAGDLPGRLDDVLAAAPSLEVVQTVSAGVDWIGDRLPDGVTLCNASGVHDTAVAEWVVAAILAMRRRLPDFLALQARGEWDAGGLSIPDLQDARVVILGHGSIGRAVEARLRPFGATVTGVARHARPGAHPPSDARELATQADVVVVLLALTAETDGFVDGAFLDAMRPGALLVNAARGRHVVTDDLIERLRSGRVRAALDVTEPEPLPAGHPLWRCPGVLITPHVAGATERWLDRALAFAGDQVRRLAAGQPLHNVRAEGY